MRSSKKGGKTGVKPPTCTCVGQLSVRAVERGVEPSLLLMILPRSSYPIKGVFFFISHPELWSKLLCPILLTFVWGLGSLAFTLAYLLPLQAHALINANCPS